MSFEKAVDDEAGDKTVRAKREKSQWFGLSRGGVMVATLILYCVCFISTHPSDAQRYLFNLGPSINVLPSV